MQSCVEEEAFSTGCKGSGEGWRRADCFDEESVCSWAEDTLRRPCAADGERVEAIF